MTCSFQNAAFFAALMCCFDVRLHRCLVCVSAAGGNIYVLNSPVIHHYVRSMYGWCSRGVLSFAL